MHFFELVNTEGVIGFLIEIAVKGTFILAAAGLAAGLLRSASASIRHLVWSTALVLLLALPAFVAFAPTYDLAVLPPSVESTRSPDLPRLPAYERAQVVKESKGTSTFAASLNIERDLSSKASVEIPAVSMAADPTPDPLSGVQRAEAAFDWRLALFVLWIIGALLVSLRYGIGWIALRRIERRAVPVSDVRLRLLAKRIASGMGLRRRIRLVWGAEGSMPLTFGCIHPTVLLPHGAKEWAPERLMVVLKHELAHVKRWDCLVQATVYMACTLYWFNPLVWIAAAQSHREREMACDDYVLSSGSAGSDYAGHLLEIARSLQGPRLSAMTTIEMARRSELEGRLMAILSPNRKRGSATLRGTLATFATLGCLVMTIAALRPVAMATDETRESPASRSEVSIPVAQVEPDPVSDRAGTFTRDDSLSIEVSARIGEQYVAEASAIVEQAAATLEASLNQLVPRTIRLNGSVAAMIDGSVNLAADGRLEIVRADTIPLEQIRRLRNAGVDVEYIEEMASVGFDRLTIEQLISLAHAGVDAGYVRSMREAGFEDLDPEDLIDLGFAGVDVEGVQVWSELGFSNLSPQELVRLSHADVDVEFVQQMRQAGYEDLAAEDLIRLSHADVDPYFIQRMSEMGLTDLSADELVQLGHAGVDVEFIAEMKASGYDIAVAGDLVALSHADVDAQFIRDLGEMGLRDLSVPDLIKLGHADIDAAFIREMRESGYTNLAVNELIQLGYADVDPDYIAELARAGVTGLSAMELVQLSHADIDADVIADLSQAGLKDLSSSDLMQLGFADVDSRFIEEMASVGLTGLSASDLVMLAHAGVDAEDVRQMRELGIDTKDPDRIVQFKYMDIDPEYVERIRRKLDR